MVLIAAVLLVPLMQYERYAAVPATNQPQFSHPAGNYNTDFVLRVTSPDRTAVVLLTDDGTDPTAADIYNESIWLHGPRTAVLRARLQWADGTLGPIVTHHYLIGLRSPIPVLSLAILPSDLWDETRGIYTNFNQRGADWERPANLFLYDPAVGRGWASNHSLAIHGSDSRRLAKKSLRLYFRDAAFDPSRIIYQNEQEVITSFFGFSPPHDFRQLVLASGGQDSSEFGGNWTLLRDVVTDGVARDLLGYGVRSRPVLLFINGEPWGIYYLRERFDERFLEQGLGLERPQLLDSPALEPEPLFTPEYQAWQELLAYVNTADMSQPQALAQVAAQIDLANFIDYHIVQFYTAPADWPTLNYQFFRPDVPGGRWHWYFWDTDYALGLQPLDPAYPASTVTSDTYSHLMEFPADQQGAAHAQLFQRLWENDEFRTQFRTRMLTLLRTTLSPEQMEARIETHAAALAPIIAYETGRWPQQSRWEDNVEELRQFVRQRPLILRQQFGMGSNEQ